MYLLQIVSEIANFFNNLLRLCFNSEFDDLYEFEKNLFSQLLQLGKRLMALKFYSLSQNLDHNQNTNLKKHGTKTFTLYSMFGKIKIKRDYFWEKGFQGHFPLDEKLNIPKRIYSYYLQKIIILFAPQSTFEETSNNINELFGLKISTKSISDIVKDVSSHSEKFRDIQPPPSKEQELLVVCTDGKGVPMKKDEIANKKTRLKKGEKSQKKKMATVGVIYSIDKEIRNADEILEKEKKKHCRPVGKRIRGKIGGKWGCEKICKKEIKITS